jgi:cytochrome P450
MGELLGKCMGFMSDPDWRKVHNKIGPHFTYTCATSYISRVDEITKKHFEALQSKERFRQGRLNPVDDLRLLPFWVATDILYGSLSSELRAELEDIIVLREALWVRMIQGGLTRYAWRQYLPSKANKDLRQFKKWWSCEASMSANAHVPIVDMFAAVKEGKMGADQLLQRLNEMLFANLDVTMGGNSWNLLFLTAHIEVQGQV